MPAFKKRSSVPGSNCCSDMKSLSDWARSRIAFDEHRATPDIEKPRTEPICANRFVIMPCVTWPAGNESEWALANVCDPVGDPRAYEMNGSSAHWLHPRRSRFIHQHQRAFPFDGPIVLRAITLQVKVSVRHEVLRVN